MKIGILIPSLLIVNCLFGQSASEIYLFDLSVNGPSIEISNPLNITNKEGYDSQPFFYHKGKRLLYTSMESQNQTDIYSYNIKSGKTSQLTATANSEYSPTTFQSDKLFSCIVVEENGDQRLWQYDLKGKSAKPVLENIKYVGYHCWIDEFRLALFIVGKPNTLKIVSKNSKEPLFVAEYIGRSIHKIPGKELITYVDKNDSSRWVINSLNPNNLGIKSIIDTKKGIEDYCLTKNGVIIMGDGRSLFKFDPSTDIDWTKIVDLKDFGITSSFNRLAVNDDNTKIAIVVNE